MTVMTSLTSVTLEVADPTAARTFYDAAFGLEDQVRLRCSHEPTTGFRGFTLSLLVSQPADADSLVDTAVEAGATVLKPAAKSFWGYGGAVRAPDGTIWKVATSAKRNTGPATRRIDEIALLLGVADVAATKRSYVDRGLAVAKSFGRVYVEFETPSSPVKLALYRRRALAKDAGVPPEGTGSHRLTLGTDAAPFTDADGFTWESAPGHRTAPRRLSRPRAAVTPARTGSERRGARRAPDRGAPGRGPRDRWSGVAGTGKGGGRV